MPRKTDNDVSWSSADAVSWQLSLDLQEAVEMLSAIRLQVLKKNPLRDTVVVAGPPGHFPILSKTETFTISIPPKRRPHFDLPDQ